ncbi:hypothetical protein AMATHDRAFT_62074, partial [Amanita thiersii Skay4041]
MAILCFGTYHGAPPVLCITVVSKVVAFVSRSWQFYYSTSLQLCAYLTLRWWSAFISRVSRCVHEYPPLRFPLHIFSQSTSAMDDHEFRALVKRIFARHCVSRALCF